MDTLFSANNFEWRTNYNSIEMAVLHKISRALVYRTNLSKFLNDILEILNAEMGLLRGTLTLRQGDMLFIEASQGLTEEEKKRGVYRMGEGVTGQVAAHAKSRIIPDITESTEFLNRTKTRIAGQKIAFICVPIIFKEQVIGTLSIDRQVSENVNLRRDKSLLETISNIIADAVSVLFLQHKEREQLLEENKRLRIELSDKLSYDGLIGKCNTMRKVKNTVFRVATSDMPVLIRGESGTGKKLVASAIVSASQRKDKPFRTLNCVALPDSVLEAELFGYENSDFGTNKIGLLKECDGGTLFIDKIADLNLDSQLKLLRFLQEKSFYKTGSAELVSSNVRIIAACDENLEEMVANGKFREDLYIQLNAVSIHLPALRDRRSDITLLAEHFITKFNQKHQKNVSRISTPAINMLMLYYWPGNVRELENCIESAVLSAEDSVIYGYNLPTSLQTEQSTNSSKFSPDCEVDFCAMVNSFERELITEALKIHRGNASASARHLGITNRMMNYKIKNLQIDPSLYKKQKRHS